MKWSRVLLLMSLAVSVYGITFRLPVGVKKCLRDEVHKDVLVVGHYRLSDAPMQKTDIKVLDTNNHILHSREDAHGTGKFAFTTDDYDMFEVCFESRIAGGGGGRATEMEREISLDLKHGAEAKDYAKLAQVEKLKPLEVELRRLEDMSESVVRNFAYMRSREEEMRDTNESTSRRVLYLTVFSIGCLVCLALWQVLYLRSYFKAKKLIE
ncbi:transmembrane emp24 domain-containing protein 10-like [Oscarella lobularis]|uniref:transmembrane emp24 domain-containing protein 10-like n=1 Tax=Oscarella lobularis TaxID=121494 RepID=UPI0033141F74